MSENEKLVLELSKKSACGALHVSISGLETQHYLLARAVGDLSISSKVQLEGPEVIQMKKALVELQAQLGDIKRLQEKMLTTLNGLKHPATST